MIIIQDLNKKFGNKVVFEHLNLKILNGTTLLMGDNEAGKTTLCKILSRQITDFKGSIEVEGIDLHQQNKVIMNFDTGLWKEKMKVSQLYEMVNETYHVNAVCHFPKLINRKCNALSKGEYRRMTMDIALQCERDWMIFDELLDGLDEVNREWVCTQLNEGIVQNKNVIFVTHEVEAVEALMEHVIFLHESQCYCADCETLRRQHGSISKAYIKWKEGKLCEQS